ncbi:amidohydrolase family protein [Roseococcus suduntuyensis]|uniref:Cytosine/adenosine deaminase-related metal-dependent hydrolase n=1 Tax=Roseococcus suduntuyensis TaxID=455361 RepID=A0A840ACC8_9PROT|nr:amidohydrolase family protein [Roseococcus suduntuyensis]MBB3898186.1 cytosine/adenosine deaminase-related metal-dependent hydrolase [Roseococcus suduntuyensis]
MPSLLLRNIGWLYTCDDRDQVLRDAWLRCEDGVMVALGAEPCPCPDADDVREMAGCIVLPGLINMHHHFFQQVTRATPHAQRAVTLEWLFGMYPLWSELDADCLHWATLAAGAEMLLTGATTSVDHSYLLPGAGSEMMEAEIGAARELGLRLHLVRSCMPTIEGDLATRLRPIMGEKMEAMLDKAETLFPRIERDLARFHDASRHSMLRLDLGPTVITYAMPEMMRRFGEMAAANDLGLHAHFLPREIERALCRQHNGMETVDFLRSVGWLTPRSWFAHSVSLDDAEIAGLGAAGCGVAHCPRTAVRLGYPVPRIAAMRQAGIAVTIGIDGGASNDDGSMLGDMRLGLLYHRTNAGAETVPLRDWLKPYDLLLMCTRVAAGVLNRPELGHLAPGMAADIAAFDLRRAAYAGAMLDPLGALLMCGADSSAKLTVVAGRVVVADGRLLSADEGRIVDGTNAAMESLTQRATRSTGLDFRNYPEGG